MSQVPEQVLPETSESLTPVLCTSRKVALWKDSSHAASSLPSSTLNTWLLPWPTRTLKQKGLWSPRLGSWRPRQRLAWAQQSSGSQNWNREGGTQVRGDGPRVTGPRRAPGTEGPLPGWGLRPHSTRRPPGHAPGFRSSVPRRRCRGNGPIS